MNAVSIRGDWVGRNIDGRFPLIAWLGGSGSTGVFLTEDSGQSQTEASGPSSPVEPRKTVIKLIAASAQTPDQITLWKRAAALSHPHLVRILYTGEVEIDGARVIYVVTELAEEVLAQIIPERPLTSGETQEMLGPVLDALACLHREGYVHGHLKPSNILVVENEVKLSSDGLLMAGKPAGEQFSNDLHNAPEISAGTVTPAADIWSLGVTLVEALTQQLPIWDAATDAQAEVPGSLPAPFAEIARECLRTDPVHRCTLEQIQAMLNGKPRLASPPPAEPVLHVPPQPKMAEQTARGKIPVVPLVVGLVLLVAIVVGLLMRSHTTQTAPVQTETTQQAPPAEPASPGTGEQPASNSSSPAEVIHQVVPDVPSGARNTIQGKVSVSVRIAVDATGTVSNAEFVSHGPSAYFARLAIESARNWRFKPPQQNGKSTTSTWILHYAFRRDGTDVKPTQTTP